jgi:hypothetical protein
MFGLGKRRRVHSETFAPNRIRGAAIAGLGMLAWQWWRKRQASNRPGPRSSQPYSDGSRATTPPEF